MQPNSAIVFFIKRLKIHIKLKFKITYDKLSLKINRRITLLGVEGHPLQILYKNKKMNLVTTEWQLCFLRSICSNI